ncbi:MAG: hypothetical protein NTW25_07850 [Candidatus Kapabacteria bacterium]|nr:hypothetical protein [Candidatus Kapabacteria bacterium]
MKIKILYVIVLFFSFFGYSKSQEDALQTSKSSKNSAKYIDIPAELKQRTTKFFNQLLDDKVNQAFEEMMLNSPINKKTEEMKSLIKQTKRAFELYGKLLSYEPVSNEVITGSFMRVRYLGLHSRYPMRWVFTFYKSPDQGWIITNVKFDDLSDFLFIDE